MPSKSPRPVCMQDSVLPRHKCSQFAKNTAHHKQKLHGVRNFTQRKNLRLNCGTLCWLQGDHCRRLQAQRLRHQTGHQCTWVTARPSYTTLFILTTTKKSLILVVWSMCTIKLPFFIGTTRLSAALSNVGHWHCQLADTGIVYCGTLGWI